MTWGITGSHIGSLSSRRKSRSPGKDLQKLLSVHDDSSELKFNEKVNLETGPKALGQLNKSSTHNLLSSPTVTAMINELVKPTVIQVKP